MPKAKACGLCGIKIKAHGRKSKRKQLPHRFSRPESDRKRKEK